MRSYSLLVVAAIISVQEIARAQYTTSANCSASFDWSVNQQNQSPCLVAAYVQGACSANGKWDVPAMPNLQVFYNPPDPVTACGCSIANYNLLSACAACQGATPPRFPYWIANCSNTGLLDTSIYYPTPKWPIPDGVQIPLWAQEDARLWTNAQFNSTEAQSIAASGKLIGPPLGSSSTTLSTTTSSSSLSSTSTTPTSALLNDSHMDVGPIVGGVVGGVLGLLLIGVLIWWIVRRRRLSFEDTSPILSAVPFTVSKEPIPALAKMAVPVPQRPTHSSYPSHMSSPPTTSHGTGNIENGDASQTVMVQHAPGILDHSRVLVSYPYATAGVGLTFSPSSMSSSMHMGQSSNTPRRMGSSSSRSMVARFIFPRRRNNPHNGAPSTTSQGSSRTSQIALLQSSPENMGHHPQLSGSSPVAGQATLEPTPYILPPPPQGPAPSPGDSTSHSQVMTKPRINPPGYTPPEATISAPLPQPKHAVQAHMTRPFDTKVNRMITTTPAPMSPPTPNPPSYMASQAENWEERLRRAASVATAGTRASSNVLPSSSTPERRDDALPTVPERAASPHDESDHSHEKK